METPVPRARVALEMNRETEQMRQGWLISALAAVAVSTAPAWAEDKAPEADTPKTPPVQAPEAQKPQAPTTQRPQGGTGPVVALGQPGAGQPVPGEEKKPTPPPPPKFTYGG